MHGNFFEAFGKKDNESRYIPNDILEELNSLLPSNFRYERDSNGQYRAVPDPHQKLCFDIEFDFSKAPELEKVYAEIGPEKMMHYLHRVQKMAPVKNMKLGTTSKLESVNKLSSDPLSDKESEIIDSWIFPSGFEKPYKLIFESPEGDKAEVEIQQVKYDSLTEIKKQNISFPALTIEMYQYSPLSAQDDPKAHTSVDHQIKIAYSVTPNKAQSVRDAVTALHIFRGLLNGTTKINNRSISSNGGQIISEPLKLESMLILWETALKLEDKLDVSFSPSAKLSSEDIELFTELDLCMLQGKMIKWKHPFDHYHISDFQLFSDGRKIDDIIGKEKLAYAFIEGPIPTKLLGAEFDLYSISVMEGFKITNIDWKEEDKDGEVYITDYDEHPWVLSRQYCTKQDAIEFYQKTISHVKDE